MKCSTPGQSCLCPSKTTVNFMLCKSISRETVEAALMNSRTHIKAPRYGAFPAQRDEFFDETVGSRSAEAMQLALAALSVILDTLPRDALTHQRIMVEPGCEHLEPLATFLHQRAHKDLTMGLRLQARHGFSRNHHLVHPFYHTAAGLMQLHSLIQQGLRAFYGALRHDYVILEGNLCVVSTQHNVISMEFSADRTADSFARNSTQILQFPNSFILLHAR